MSITLLFLFSLLKHVISINSTCNILALSGGGDKGAYQAGVIKGFVDTIPKAIEWDVITGISIGSINAVALSLYDIGKEKEAAEFLLEKWRHIKGKSDIYKEWRLGPLYGLLFKTSLYDTSPSRKMLSELLRGKPVKRKFIVGGVEIKDGAFITWDETTLIGDDYIDAIMSSAAYPVLFPHINFRNQRLMDGGVKFILDISSGVIKCKAMGYEEENIVIDSILLSSKFLPEIEYDNLNAIKTLIRVFEIIGFDNAMRDIENAKKDFPKCSFRYLVAPSRKLPSCRIPLTFSPENIEKMINIGIEDAVKAVKNGYGEDFTTMLKEYEDDRTRHWKIK